MLAKSLLEKNILNQVQNIVDFVNVPIEETGLQSDVPDGLEMTHFDDIYDTLIYSNLIAKAIELNPQVTRVVDLGAGSSVPTLLALKQHEDRPLSATAVDIDTNAIIVGKKNAMVLGLDERFNFKLADLEGIVNSSFIKDTSTLIVSNPPYIATPSEVDDHFFIPINGGPEGDKYLLDILKNDFPKGTPLALLWGSLTCPFDLLKEIEERYELMHTEAYRINFGNYTTKQPIKSHLYKLREEGKVYFESTSQGDVQIVIGTILRAK